jgi:hypothetical protein
MLSEVTSFRVARFLLFASPHARRSKDLWERCAYRDVTVGEDWFFLEDTRAVIQPDHHAEWSFMVVRHGAHKWQTENASDVTSRFRSLPRYDRRLAEIAGDDGR